MFKTRHVMRDDRLLCGSTLPAVKGWDLEAALALTFTIGQLRACGVCPRCVEALHRRQGERA